MEEHQPSRTAMAAAFYRAHHAAHDSSDDSPLIFNDTLAGLLLPKAARAALEQSVVRLYRELDPAGAAAHPDQAALVAAGLRATPNAALVLSRARWAEDLLAEALARGVEQYVIVGAGLDTYALRRGESLGALRVWEVDHPATQRFKRRRIAELGWACPGQLSFVEADLARESLAGALAGSGFARARPSFFNWLGVTYYLPPEAVLATLAAIADIGAPGSAAVFDYRDAQAAQQTENTYRCRLAQANFQRLGEPILSQFAPADLARDLAGLGLAVREDLGPADIQARYFPGRQDGYQAHGSCRFLCVQRG
jgi:methyltransferase (TIGR00027 family)